VAQLSPFFEVEITDLDAIYSSVYSIRLIPSGSHDRIKLAVERTVFVMSANLTNLTLTLEQNLIFKQ
jgi:hypothetical protein